ncbi:hypothetical protein [Nocardioides sp.]|uniref:hypothetical protein n=1 Tax=Nocardioides sp. TaxID=35761 RepID=UPI002CD59734|nr:hypothetical protein [Nocardioides sp.]HXH79598.1 hypothetical protein [Nocardioides sp.]
MLKTKVAVPWAVLVVATIVLLGLGLFMGTKLPWGEKSARTVEGTAFLEDPETGLASVEWGDSDMAALTRRASGGSPIRAAGPDKSPA